VTLGPLDDPVQSHGWVTLREAGNIGPRTRCDETEPNEDTNSNDVVGLFSRNRPTSTARSVGTRAGETQSRAAPYVAMIAPVLVTWLSRS
jgi:hypothetical protein